MWRTAIRPLSQRDLFNQVQQEMTRRSSKRKVLQKSGKTELGKYSGKYALTELLVCGECGSPYKRVTWARNGKKRIVWRCVSRLEFGTKYCQHSPTLDEGKLHSAILDAMNEYAAIRQEVCPDVLAMAEEAKSIRQALSQAGARRLQLKKRMDAVSREQSELKSTSHHLRPQTSPCANPDSMLMSRLAAKQKSSSKSPMIVCASFAV